MRHLAAVFVADDARSGRAVGRGVAGSGRMAHFSAGRFPAGHAAWGGDERVVARRSLPWAYDDQAACHRSPRFSQVLYSVGGEEFVDVLSLDEGPVAAIRAAAISPSGCCGTPEERVLPAVALPKVSTTWITARTRIS